MGHHGSANMPTRAIVLLGLQLLLAASAPVSTDSCTGSNLPVLGGIDVVDFGNLKESSWTAEGDAPTKGLAEFTGKLNGYNFLFKNADNQAKFAADPWAYAPAWGGF